MKPLKLLTRTFLLFFLLGTGVLSAQVGINEDNTDPDASAMLDIKSTDKGILIPRMTATQRDAVSSPATGLMVYVTDDNSFYYYEGTGWTKIGADDLGDHIASQNLQLNGHYLSGDGGNEGVFVNSDGKVGIGTNFPEYSLDAVDSVRMLKGTKDIVFTSGHYGPSSLSSTDLFFNRNDAGFNQSEFVLYNINNNIASSRFFQLQYTDDAGGLTLRKGGSIGINNTAPDASAMLDIQSTEKGLLIPRMTTVERDAVISPAAGLMVYITDDSSFHYYEGTGWTKIGADDLGDHTATQTLDLNSNDISNADTVAATAFVGDGANLTNVPGDDLGDHQATQDIELKGHKISNDGAVGLGFYGLSLTNQGSVNLDGYDPKFQLNNLNFAGSGALWAMGIDVESFYITGSNINNSALYINSLNKIGINTTSPSQQLDVNGKIRMREGAVSGHLPVSDANGVMTWTDPDSLGIGDDLGDHQATQDIELKGHKISNDGAVGLGFYGLSLTNQGSANLDGYNPKFQLNNLNFAGSGALWAMGIDVESFYITGSIINNSALYINSLNKIGINTTSPSQQLDVNGKIRMRDGAVSGHMPVSDANGVMTWTDPATLSFTVPSVDNLGDHTATQTLDLNSNDLMGAGTITATAFVGDGSALTNLPSDNLGDHTATQTLDLNSNDLMGAGTITATAFVGDGSALTNLPSDNLGDHTATQNIELSGNYLSGDGGNEGVFVANNGNTGIGTDTSPAQKLEVGGNVQLSSLNPQLMFFEESNSETRRSMIKATHETGLIAPAYTSADQKMSLHVSNNTANGMTQVMTLQGNGYVGIGSNSPDRPVTIVSPGDWTDFVNGADARLEGPNALGAGISLNSTATDGKMYTLLSTGPSSTIGAGGFGIWHHSSGYRLAISPNGDVGIGTNTPDFQLHARDDANGLGNFVMKIENTANSNSSNDEGLLIQAGHDIYNPANESSFIQFETPSGTFCGRIRQSGGASVGYTSASDRRLKENILPTRFGLADLMKIEVRDYNYKVDDDSLIQTGFIAQQLYTAYSPAVSVGGDDVNTQPWEVAYGSMTPLLVQAVQDQQEIIDQQKVMIKQQQTQIDAILTQLGLEVKNRILSPK